MRRQATGAIIRKDGKILICQRAGTDALPLSWEFPGGKVRPFETPERCIIREMKEELGSGSKYCLSSERIFTILKTREVFFTVFNAEIEEGEVQKRVHEDFRWVRAGEAYPL
jgi:8-oxo-dGTP diphosphatase